MIIRFFGFHARLRAMLPGTLAMGLLCAPAASAADSLLPPPPDDKAANVVPATARGKAVALSVALQQQADRAFGANPKDQSAVKAYTQAALADPQNPTTRLCLGVALAAARRDDLAVFQFKKAAQLAPDDLLSALLLQNALQEGGEAADAQEMYLDIAQKFARKDNKPGWDAHSSIARLKAATVQFPQSPILFLLLGDAFQLAEQWSDADKAYETARYLAPKWEKPCVNLGLSRLAQNKPDEAIRILNTALVIDPSNVQARLWKGNAELKAGKGEAAARSFSMAASGRAARVSPGVAAQAATGMGQALASSRQFDKALVSLQNAQKIAPSDPVPPALIGEVHVENGEFAQAAGAYSTALRLTRSGGLFSNRPVLYRALAEAQLCARKPNDAIESLNRALMEEPDSASLWHRLKAQAHFDRNAPADAQQELRAALDATLPGEYPLDTLNAIAARNLTGTMQADYQTDYDNSGSGIRRTTLPGGAVALQSPSPSAVFSGGASVAKPQSEAATKIRALRALASLARYRGDTSGEIHYRSELTALSGTGQDWLMLAETYDSRAGQPANARAAYGKALEIGGLPASAVARVRERLVRLNAPLYKP